MSGKSIVIKAVIGVVIVSILSGLIYFLSLPEKEEASELLSVFSADESKVEEIRVMSKTPFTLTLENSQWVMEGMEGVGVNAAYAKSLVKSLCNLYSPMLTEEDVENGEKYGIGQNNGIKIELVFSESSETVEVGNRSGEFYYVCVDKKVYIVNEKDLYMVFMDKMDYLDMSVISIDENSINYIEYSDVVLVKENEEWQEENPYRLLTNSNAVKEKIVTAVSSIEAVEIENKADVKLNKETSVKIKTFEDEYNFEVCKGEKGYYIVKENSDYVYRVAEGEVSFVNVTGFDLLEKYIAPVAISEVKEIKMISPKETVILSIEAPSTQAPFFYKDGEEVTEDSFRKFYQILVGLTFSGEGTASKSAEYAVIFTKESGEIFDVRFIPSEDGEYAVSINGKTQFVILKKSVTDVFDYLSNIEYVK